MLKPDDGPPHLPLNCHTPPAGTLLTHIVYSGILDELSNAEPPLHYLRGHIFTKGWKKSATLPKNTIKPLMFIHYQTQFHGPQNGWRLVVVEVGNDPERVSAVLDGLGRIERDTAEMVVFPSTEEEVYIIKDSSGESLDARVMPELLSCGAIPTVGLEDMIQHVREKAFLPTTLEKPEPDLNSSRVNIERDVMFSVENRRLLVVAKKGTGFVNLEDTLREGLGDGRIRDGDAVIFGYATEGIVRFDGTSGAEGKLKPPSIDPSSVKEQEPCDRCKEANTAMLLARIGPTANARNRMRA